MWLAIGHVAQGVDGVWTNAGANAPWTNANNWSGGNIPDVAGAIADFSTLNIGAARTVNLNSNRTVGTLIFGDIDDTHGWTLANGGTGTGNKITLATTNSTPGVIQVNNRTTTISAILAGTQGFDKTGAGTLVLSNGANTLTGGINLVAGELDFALNALGGNLVTFTAASNLTWVDGNTQDVSSQIKINDGVIATLHSGPNTVTLATALQTGPLGTGSLTKGGMGTFIITAANTYTGATRINNGTAVLTGGDNRLSTATTLSLGNGNNNGIVQLGDASGKSDQTVTGLTTAGSGVLNALVGGHTTVSTLTVNNATASTYNGILGGAGVNQNNLALVKSGTGSLTLNNASSSFTGDVTINGGNLIVRSGTSLGSGPKTVYIKAATDTPSLQLNGSTGSFNLAAGINYVTSNDDATAPAILNTAGDNVIHGNISPTTGGAGTGNTRIKTAAGTLILNGNIAPTVDATGPLTVIFDAETGSSGTVNGTIANTGANTLGVTKEGSGTWTLNAANTYTGATTVTGGQLNITTAQTGGGTISTGDDTTLGVRLKAAGQSLVTSGLTLGAATGSQLSFDLGSFSSPTAPLISAGTFTTNGLNIINVAGTGLRADDIFDLIAYTGTIGGSGFSGLQLGTTPARVTAELVDNSAGSTVQLKITAFDVPKWTGATDNVWDINDDANPNVGNGTVNWREAISGTDTRYLQIDNVVDSVLFDDSAEGTEVNLTATLTPTTVTVDNTDKTYTFIGAGKLSGGTAIVKRGTGTFILANTGGNDYTGTTTIAEGTLQIGDGITTGGGQLGQGAVLNEGALVFDRPDDFIVANAISGSGTIQKKNTGLVTLSGNNAAFHGNILVSGGVLKVSNVNALGSLTGTTTVATGGVLDVTSFNVTESLTLTGGTLRSTGGTATAISGPLALNGGGILEAYNSTTFIINTGITGTGPLVKTGNGTVVLLSNANAYNGGTTINQGILQIGANGGAGSVGSIGTGDIHLAATAGNTATLQILRGDSSLDISNTITSGGDGTNSIVIGVTGASSPSGTVTFSGINTFTNDVTISGGTLKITNSSALGVGPKTVRIASNATPSLRLDGSSAAINLDSSIAFAISSDGGGLTPGAIVSAAGNNIINGVISVINGSGGQGQITVEAGTLDLAGRINSTGSTGARTVLIGGAGNGTVSGIVEDTDNVLSVTKNGTGTWTLTNDNTYTGATNVAAGTLRISNIAAVGDAQSLGQGTTAVTIGTATTTGTLEYIGAVDADLGRAFTVNGAGGAVIRNSGGAVLTLSGLITRAARPLTFTGGNFIVAGQITGGAADLNIDGGSVTFTSATSNYAGPTKVYNGATLKNGVTNAIAPNTTVTLGEATGNTAGTYDLNGFDSTIRGLTDAGTGARVVTNSAASGTNTLTLTNTSTFGGSIRDGGTAKTAVTKSGTGTFTLTTAQTYTGPTTISGGTLAVAGSASLSSATTVKAGGSLSLAGTIYESVLVEESGSLHAGGTSSIGTSTIDGGLTLNSGANLYFDINGTTRGVGYDAINALTDFVLAGTLNVNLGSGYTITGGDTFNLFDWTVLGSTGSVTDNGYAFNFTGASLGPEYVWDTTSFLSTGSISIIAVPEPGRPLLLVAATMVLLARRRRRA